MGRLTTDKKTAILGALVEGASIRSTERMTGVHRDTITKVVNQTGKGCDRVMADEIRDVQCSQLQLDEIWCFVGKKRAQLAREDDLEKVGDFWTWVALDPDSKLVPHHHVGKRNADHAVYFTRELGRRVPGRVQISTDKLYAYREAVHAAWGRDVDYGQIVKRFKGGPLDSGRYSPPKVVAVDKRVVHGNPDPSKISTSLVERQNLTMRTQMRRFTRLTNGFSKKVENLKAACSLHFAHYNLVRVHGTIKTTPAIAAGVANRRWTLEELVEAGELYGR